MKEPKDFTCLMLIGFKVISSRFVLLVLSKSLRKVFLKCSFIHLAYNLKRNGFGHQEFHIYCTFVNAEVFSYIVPFMQAES